MISSFMASIGNHTNIKIEEDLLRHMVLNSIRSYNMKFKAKYGEMVIACDSMYSWRRDVFPYYKANRKKARQQSEIDWTELFNVLTKLKSELKEYFPYRVIEVEKAEADDIIGTLVKQYADTTPILIISGDKDFRQLQKYEGVEQYDPVRKKSIVEKTPELYLREHIIRGDMGDGVPNFLSKDDVYVTAGRSKPIRSKKLAEWLFFSDPTGFCDEEMLRGWKRNQQLVDLEFTPESIREQILAQYEEQAGKGRSKIFNYFIQNKLKNLMEAINEF